MYTGMLIADSNSLISFPIWVTLISFSSLIVPVWTQYWKEQEQWVVLCLSWLLKNFSIKDDVVCMFFFILWFLLWWDILRTVFTVLYYLGLLKWKHAVIFKDIFYINCDEHEILPLSPFVVYYIYWVADIKPTLHLWDKAKMVIVDNLCDGCTSLSISIMFRIFKPMFTWIKPVVLFFVVIVCLHCMFYCYTFAIFIKGVLFLLLFVSLKSLDCRSCMKVWWIMIWIFLAWVYFNWKTFHYYFSVYYGSF